MLWAFATYAFVCLSDLWPATRSDYVRGHLGMVFACLLDVQKQETAAQICATAAILWMMGGVKITVTRGSVMFLATCLVSVLLFAVFVPAESTLLPWPLLHLAMYVVLGYMNPSNFTLLVIVSTIWEMLEILCGGILFQEERVDRLTDTICNVAGFLIGTMVRELIY